MKKLFIVVLYKNEVQNSQTCKTFIGNSLNKNDDNFFLIWDNSPEEINTHTKCSLFFQSENIDFHHTPENISLAKIYNYALDNYSNFDMIQIFDQDSAIVKDKYNEYLNKVLLENEEINIFLPKVFSKGQLYSPGKFHICRGSHFSDLASGLNKYCYYTAIMSGTVVRPMWLNKNGIRFNEELSLYCIDTDFFNKCRKLDSRFYVMELDFYHELSEAYLTLEQKKNRRKLQVEGLKIMYKSHYILVFFVRIYELILKITRRM